MKLGNSPVLKKYLDLLVCWKAFCHWYQTPHAYTKKTVFLYTERTKKSNNAKAASRIKCLVGGSHDIRMGPSFPHLGCCTVCYGRSACSVPYKIDENNCLLVQTGQAQPPRMHYTKIIVSECDLFWVFAVPNLLVKYPVFYTKFLCHKFFSFCNIQGVDNRRDLRSNRSTSLGSIMFLFFFFSTRQKMAVLWAIKRLQLAKLISHSADQDRMGNLNR